MAFYKSIPDKNKTRTNYAQKGSWEEEGTRYHSSQSKKNSFTEHSDRFRQEKKYYKKNDEHKYTERECESRLIIKSKRYTENINDRNVRRFDKQKEERTDNEKYRSFQYQPHHIISENQEEKTENNILCGRNPIREALKYQHDIEKLLVQKGELSGSAKEIVQMAKAAHIPVQIVEKNRMDEIAQHHQGLIAYASAYQYSSIDDILKCAEERKEAPFIIILDGITDPHNLGAIIRSAECSGAHGVIVPQRRSVGLTPAAVKASAGAIEHVHVARVVNINRTIDELKEKNIWTYAVNMNGSDYLQTDFSGGVALVIGAEGEGISRLTQEHCDYVVSLPMKGHLDSLNASVAAGIMMYRVLSCRNHL